MLQGLFWHGGGAAPEFLTSSVMQFGSRVGPSYGQRLANLCVALFHIDMDRWEAKVRRSAEAGDSTSMV